MNANNDIITQLMSLLQKVDVTDVWIVVLTGNSKVISITADQTHTSAKT